MNKAHSLRQYVGLSVLIHLLLCACLFLAVIHKQLPFPQTASFIKPEVVPAPVMFVQEEPQQPEPPKTTPLDVDPPGVPNGLRVSMAEFPDQALLTNKKPGLPDTKDAPATAKKMPVPTPTLQKEIEKLPDTKKAPDLTQLEKKAEGKIPVPKELSLADLFKNAQKAVAHDAAMLTSQDGGGGPSGQIVITEGSLKYYSLWSKFLSHLNDAARFNRRGGINQQVQQWLQTGLIKKEALFAIDVNKKGQVINVTLLSSSGHTPFDTLCISDIWSAVPFPPLPDSIDRPTARFQVKAFF